MQKTDDIFYFVVRLLYYVIFFRVLLLYIHVPCLFSPVVQKL